ncbi:HNH endonuclease signature motif containing protein [Micromonospora sp. WMMA1363]|uniref:HNH endonuclease n=1 Tax=Micromonospora sp. WMMA1363 TaxID=3053985 RepID=UPI00259CA7BF|nr:HNH endonuclease signature motif containing protein [Micromonospora sp. WMMA1363]MDM4721145.1 HNH endonuclease signature motif containing protein [Micromonospora sp. WMMA1363]
MSQSWSGGSTTRWRTLRARVLRLDLPPTRRPRCAIGYPRICTDEATCVDHIVPLHMGGAKYDEANCRPACQPCNLARPRREQTTVAHEPPPKRVSTW